MSRKALICSASRAASSSLPSLTSALVDADLPIGPEFDAVRRVDVDHLDLAAQLFTFGEGGHDLERVAEDHAVGPVGVVTVEVDGVQLVESVEDVEERQLWFVLGPGSSPAEVFDQDAGVDLFLDVDGWRVRGTRSKAVPSMCSASGYLPFQTQLGVEALVSGVADFADRLDLGGDELLCVGRRDVGPLVRVVDGVDRCGFAGITLRHWTRPVVEVEQVWVSDDRLVAVEGLDRAGQHRFELRRIP